MSKRSKSLVAGFAGIVLLATGFALSPAYAVPDYPSAAEVAAAKRNVEEKKKMIARIEGILDTLQEEADALEAVALQKNEQYNQAKQAVKIMADKVEGLQAKVVTAQEDAEEAKTMLGQIVARMYRQGTSGNTTLEIFFNPESSDELLYQLGASDVVAQRTQVMYEQAMQKQADAKALASELASAQTELESRRAAAEKLYREAKSAADAVIAKVSESESQRATMLGQLANLKDTASDLERQRIEGLEAERRQNAVKDAPTAPELYTVGPPNEDLVEKAIAFASAQLGERYVLGGSGPDIWDCSGITMKSYAAAGVYIGWHSATAQFNIMASNQKLVPFQDAKRGDLIWWTRSSSFSGDKYHTAIYLGNGMMLESPNPARTVRIVPVRYGELFPYAARPTAN
jgi:cell wall-associated NlpC family hydrolase/Skp family chaperone for outer membrane proteins